MRKKFKSWDNEFLQARSNFEFYKDPKKGDWDLIDHFPLYIGQRTLARHLAIYELFKSTLDVPGDYVELGSWKGANILYLAKLLSIYARNSPKEIFCFDTFEGLQTFEQRDHEAKRFQNSYAGNQEYMERCLNLFGLSDSVHIHRGDISSTFPQLMTERPELIFSFIYFDTDLYLPTQAVLEYVTDRTYPGAKLIFDEWNDAWFPGEGMAVNEFIEKSASHFEVSTLSYTPAPSLVLTRK
jgi:hypothetical protein